MNGQDESEDHWKFIFHIECKNWKKVWYTHWSCEEIVSNPQAFQQGNQTYIYIFFFKETIPNKFILYHKTATANEQNEAFNITFSSHVKWHNTNCLSHTSGESYTGPSLCISFADDVVFGGERRCLGQRFMLCFLSKYRSSSVILPTVMVERKSNQL